MNKRIQKKRDKRTLANWRKWFKPELFDSWDGAGVTYTISYETPAGETRSLGSIRLNGKWGLGL